MPQSSKRSRLNPSFNEHTSSKGLFEFFQLPKKTSPATLQVVKKEI